MPWPMPPIRLQHDHNSRSVFQSNPSKVEAQRSVVTLLQKGILDFFASVHGGDDDEEGTAGDDETEFSVTDVVVGVLGENVKII